MSWFVKRYSINMSEAEHPKSHYKSIGDLFTRKLKSGIRPIGKGLVSPVDGTLTTRGFIKSGQLIQAKESYYSIEKFLNSSQLSSAYEGGSFLTYYLCPSDYHRVHSPVEGFITKVTHVPGSLWPVNPWSVEHISQLFAVNERVIIEIKTALGAVQVVMVGATNVGKITLSFDDSIVSNQSLWFLRGKPKVTIYENPKSVQAGDELGTFNMGSTVILVLP